MIRLINANLVLWASLLCTFNAYSSSLRFDHAKKISCGRCEINGMLKRNRNGQFIVQLYGKTPWPLEFVLLGGDISDKLTYLNTPVSAEVYVPKAGKASAIQLVALKKLALNRTNAPEQIIQKSELKCHDKTEIF